MTLTRVQASKKLLTLFMDLKGPEFRQRYIRKNEIMAEWQGVFGEILDQTVRDGVSWSKLVAAMRWALAGRGADFWPGALQRPQNLKDNLDKILDGYESDLAVEQHKEGSDCTCKKIDGDRYHPETGDMLPCDWKCPKHGKGGSASMVGMFNVEWFNTPGQAPEMPAVPKEIQAVVEPIEAPPVEEPKGESVEVGTPSFKGKVFKKGTKTCKGGQYHQEDFSHKFCTTCGGGLVD
jgi:hypothetical protein